MKRNEIIAWVIILVILVGIVIWVASDSNIEPEENNAGPKEDDRKKQSNFFKRLSERIETMQREVTDELEKLRMTKEMQNYLNQKVNRLLTLIKIVIGLTMGGAIAFLMNHGFDVWTSILTFCGVICIIVPVTTFFFFTKCMSVKEFVDRIIMKIKQLMFRKYGCDSVTISEIESTIAVKKEVINSLSEVRR